MAPKKPRDRKRQTKINFSPAPKSSPATRSSAATTMGNSPSRPNLTAMQPKKAPSRASKNNKKDFWGEDALAKGIREGKELGKLLHSSRPDYSESDSADSTPPEEDEPLALVMSRNYKALATPSDRSDDDVDEEDEVPVEEPKSRKRRRAATPNDSDDEEPTVTVVPRKRQKRVKTESDSSEKPKKKKKKDKKDNKRSKKKESTSEEEETQPAPRSSRRRAVKKAPTPDEDEEDDIPLTPAPRSRRKTTRQPSPPVEREEEQSPPRSTRRRLKRRKSSSEDEEEASGRGDVVSGEEESGEKLILVCRLRSRGFLGAILTTLALQSASLWISYLLSHPRSCSARHSRVQQPRCANAAVYPKVSLDLEQWCATTKTSKRYVKEAPLDITSP
jgi:hypothetical protein